MRIITGSARGTQLKTLEGDETRPTSERIKEAIFSSIQFEIHDRSVLDLFGGSGQLALEALSRGASTAIICDNSRAATEIIKGNIAKTNFTDRCRVVTSDWKDFLKGNSQKFSLVILDPPYKDRFMDEVLQRIFAANILTDNAIIICETSIESVPVPPDNAVCKGYKYGKTYISIIRNSKNI
ncbi:MAG: 16S rRNA (guanine(966)-N(2))-methyltransferase RsmD [Clostridia bacterium]